MTDIERALRAAMHGAVDGEPPPADLVPAVLRRHRRYLVRLAGAAVAGAIVVAAIPVALASGELSTGPGHGVTGAARSPVLSTPAPSSHSPSPRRSRTSAPAQRHREPAWMRGLQMPPSESLRLLVTARDPVWFASPADSSQQIAGLPRSHYPYSVTGVNGGWAMMLQPACKCQAPREPVYYVADGSASARRVGIAQVVFPGSGRGTMWLAAHNKGKKGTTAREVGSSGRTIGSPVLLPRGQTIQQGVGPYLLLSPSSQQGTVIYKLWNPKTRQVIRRFPNVIASSGDQVAWGICAGCAVHVLDLRTGVTSSVSVPRGIWAYDGQFSADGRYLAVHLSGGVRPDGWSTLTRIAVIDLRTGRLRILTGSSIGTDVPAALTVGWQGGSDTLIAAVTGHTVTQIGTWHQGAAQLALRKFWLPQGMTVVLGPYG